MTALLNTILCLFLTIPSGSLSFNVKDFGARGDGRALDSPHVDQAIEAAASAGGGTVYFPQGTYRCGSMHLKSNIHLYLDNGCTIVASPRNPGDYDREEASSPWEPYQDAGHTYFENSLFWGRGLENVSISGEGKIDGRGLTRKTREPGRGKIGLANKAICLVECKNVSIKDITIFKGGHFAILLTGCSGVVLDGLSIDTNRDGIDIDCCKDVIVSGCRVNSPQDDAICAKSSYALGRKIVTENLVIKECEVSAYRMGTLLDGTRKTRRPSPTFARCGRIKFGTESNGGFRNCVISDCKFLSCKGLALEEVDGGVMENIVVSNLTMEDLTGYAIYIQLGERLRDPDQNSSSAGRNILISNVLAEVTDKPLTGIFISGTPRFTLEDISLKDITVYVKGGASRRCVKSDFPEIGRRYPELSAFRKRVPAYGLYSRHVTALNLDSVQVFARKPDARPATIIK